MWEIAYCNEARPPFGTECEINLAMISLICSEWHPLQVKGASARLCIHVADWLPSRPLVRSHISDANGLSRFASVPSLHGVSLLCLFFFHRWAPDVLCSPKHLLRMRLSLNGSRDLFRPRRYRCNRYESHLEPGSENASRCFIKNKKYWLSFIRKDCSIIRFLWNWKCSIYWQNMGFLECFLFCLERKEKKISRQTSNKKQTPAIMR